MLEIEFLSKSKTLIGFSYEVQNHCISKTDKGELIIHEMYITSLGLLFMTINFIVKGKRIE